MYSSTLYFLAAAVATKSLQLCPTLCDPIDRSPPGSPVPGILQARTLEWVAISHSNAWKWKVKVKSFSHGQHSATPWTAALQAPLSMGFSRQEYWRGCHCLLQYFPASNHKIVFWVDESISVLQITSFVSFFPTHEQYLSFSFWLISFFKILFYLTLQYCIGFAIYQNKMNLTYFIEPIYSFSSVQSLTHVRLFVTLWIAARQASLSITNSQS